MRRLALMAVVACVLAGCGGARSRSVVLKSTDPLMHVYVQVHGSSGLVSWVQRSLVHGHSNWGTFVVVPVARGPEYCSNTVHIAGTPYLKLGPRFRRFEGQKATVVVYGRGHSIPTPCDQFGFLDPSA